MNTCRAASRISGQLDASNCSRVYVVDYGALKARSCIYDSLQSFATVQDPAICCFHHDRPTFRILMNCVI
jgi:hypothetical protein